MTIQDLIEAGITLQGMLTVRVYDDNQPDGGQMTEAFKGEAEDLEYPEYMDEPWLCEHEISFIYSHDPQKIPGWCIEVQPHK